MVGQNVPPIPPPHRGAYINLDRSPERRARIEAGLARFGLAPFYRRLTATDGGSLPMRAGITPGERGCFHSHMTALAEALNTPAAVHVLEDDAILSPYVLPAIDLVQRAGVLKNFDLIFTEMFVPPDLGAIRQMKMLFDQAHPGGRFDPAKLQIVDLASTNFSCASSYIVNPESLAKIVGLCRQEWERGPTLAYDIFLRREVQQKRLRAACLMPFVTSIDLDLIGRSTIAGRSGPHATGATNPAPLVMALIRHSFFVGRDLDGIAFPLLAQALSGVRPDRHRDFLQQALGFVLSDEYRAF